VIWIGIALATNLSMLAMTIFWVVVGEWVGAAGFALAWMFHSQTYWVIQRGMERTEQAGMLLAEARRVTQLAMRVRPLEGVRVDEDPAN
jgi:hypothetical protein